MKNLELTEVELSIISMLLMKEEKSARIEAHHARGVFEYSEYLRDREKKVHRLLDKVNRLAEAKNE
mgnify:FL=1